MARSKRRRTASHLPTRAAIDQQTPQVMPRTRRVCRRRELPVVICLAEHPGVWKLSRARLRKVLPRHDQNGLLHTLLKFSPVFEDLQYGVVSDCTCRTARVSRRMSEKSPTPNHEPTNTNADGGSASLILRRKKFSQARPQG